MRKLAQAQIQNFRLLELVIVIECILTPQVPGVSMRLPPCTDADDLLRCSATVGNSGERGETDSHPYLGKALESFAWCAKDRSKHTGPPF